MEIVLSVDALLSSTFLGLLGGSVCVGQTSGLSKSELQRDKKSISLLLV